jgi:pSer/pThr/pTyr-binding forkhead associated (FHA) protein
MTPDGASAYVVVRREDGFGDVCALTAGQRYTLGRATTNRIVLKDELCSREHAEIYYADGRWRVRDLNSLNGTRVNDTALEGEWELSPEDEVHVGRTRLIFVDTLDRLPELPSPSDSGGVAIKKRLGHTRFLTPIPPTGTPDGSTPAAQPNHNLNRELSLLYRLALDMGSASDIGELVAAVLDGLLEGTPADVGAILSVKEERKLDVLDHRERDQSGKGYRPVSEYVSNEVLESREAVLAVDIAGDRHLSNRESLADIGATA